MELLSPAGNYLSALCAFNAGADAIYLGGKAFSARMSADNFDDEEMKKIIIYAHLLNKKVFVTMNTLIYQDEFNKAVKYAEFLHQNNVDGLIIQDLGFAFYLHQVYPNLILHASTQLNCHNLDQAKALKKIGFKRIVLAREAPLSLIKEVKAIGLEVEVFIHGALCVSFSGNCLMSSFIGDRSGNRGRCAQPCRMKYSLMKENEEITSSYMISTKDLNTLQYIDELKKENVDSLKIEGRLKQLEYVYLVTKAYRNALDKNNKSLKNDQENLQNIFSRTFTKGYMFNESIFSLLNQNSSSHQGERIGYVKYVKNNNIYIFLEKNIHRLDGIRFNDNKQNGLQIQKMFVNHTPVEEAKKGQIIEIKNVSFLVKNDVEVIRTSSYLLIKKVEEENKKIYKRKISGRITAYKNKPLIFEIFIGKAKIKKVSSLVQTALNKGTSKERIIDQFTKVNSLPLTFEKIEFNGDEDIFIPISQINELRNSALDELIKLFTKENKIIKNEYSCSSSKESEKLLNLTITSKIKYQNIDTLTKANRINFKHLNYEKMMVDYFVEGNLLIASPYCNITNSYALDAYFAFNYQKCFLSNELDKDSIKNIIDDYYFRHQIYPNVGLQIYGRLEMMIMKSCPIGTYYHNQKDHCNRCKKNQFYLKDRMNALFPLLSDENCITTVLDYRILYLINRLDELKNMHIKNYYLSFTLENEDEAKKIIENVYNNFNEENTLNNSSYYLGHYIRRAL